MGGKKDPGKFTVRFNIADPQQRTAAELLNQQGRCKAQFITNAVLFYVHNVPGTPIPTDTIPAKWAEAGHSVPSEVDVGTAEEDDLASIRRTIEAFQAP